jgi:G8 domain
VLLAVGLMSCASADRHERDSELSQAVLTCNKTSVGSGDWDASSTWSPAGAPAANDVVCIAAGHLVTLNANPTNTSATANALGQVQVNGTLRFSPAASVTLQSKGNIVVSGSGRLEMKPSTVSQVHAIQFVEVNENAYVGGGMVPLDSDVGLWVTENGVWDAQGTSKKSWSKATASIPVNAVTIAVDSTTGWQPGDQVVITPTNPPNGGETHYAEFESLIVASTTATSVTFTTPTQKAHPLVNGLWGAEVLNLTRNVKVSGTCTLGANPEVVSCLSADPSLVQHRAHIMFSHVEQTQTLKHLELFNLGPRQQGTGKTVSVLGRYGLHFHMSMATGHLVDSLAVHEIGAHAYVPHASHGMTISNCISYNTWDEPFWYDLVNAPADKPLNDTNNLTLDGDVAAWVNADPFQAARLAAFVLGGGQGNTVKNSVAVGVRGGVTSSGFEWPENRIDSAWTFHDNVSHNNRIDGIFTWQNWGYKTPHHLIENSTVYHNGMSGIEHGAYGNAYHYRNLNVYGNYFHGVRLHSSSIDAHVATQTFEGLTIDGAGLTVSGIQIASHNAQVSVAGSTLFKNNVVRNLRADGKAVRWEYEGRSLDLGDGGIDLDAQHLITHREWFRFIDNDFQSPSSSADFFLSGSTGVDGKAYGVTPLSDVYVSKADGERYTLRALSFANPFVEDFDPPSPDYGTPGQATLGPKWFRWTYRPLSGAIQALTRESNDTGKVSGSASGTGLIHPSTVEGIDVSQSVLATVSHSSSLAGLFARRMEGDERRTYYLGDAGISGSSHPLSIWRVVDGVPTLLASQPGTYFSSGVGQTLEFTVAQAGNSTSLSARLGTGSLLTFTDTDSRLQSRAGRFGLSVSAGPSTQAVTFDHYVGTIDPAGIAQDRFNAKIQQWAAPGTPIVDAGPNTSARLPTANVPLHGSARDGSAQNPPGLTYAWSVVTGPSGGATILNATARDTYASFSSAGLYILRLTASDGTLTSSDDVQVVVSPAQASNVFDEAFNVADNAPWPSTFTATTSGAPNLYVSGTSGVVQGANPFWAWMNAKGYNARNVDITAKLEVSANAVFGGVYARRSDDDPNTYLAAYFGANSAGSDPQGVEDLRIVAVVDGQLFDLEARTLSPPPATQFNNLRFLVETRPDGTIDLHAKLWPASGTEPSAWTLERLGYSDPIFQGKAGRFGAFARSSVTNRWVAFDTFHADVLDAPAATIVTEPWTGSNGAAWPSQWSGTPVSGTVVAIQGNEGQVAAPSGYGGVAKYINTYQALGVDLVTNVRLNPNNARGGLVALYDPVGVAFVGVKFGVTTFDMDAVRIYSYANGAATDLAKITSSFTQNTNYQVLFNVEVVSPTSANLRAKVCAASCVNDGTWTVQKLAWTPSAAISLVTPGRFGIFAEEGQAGRITTFDNFQATFVAQ